MLRVIVYYFPHWNWLCDRIQIPESCKAAPASLYIPNQPESTFKILVPLLFPKAAADSSSSSSCCGIWSDSPLLAGSLPVVQERDHRACIPASFDSITDNSGRPDGMSGERLETGKAEMPSPARRDSATPAGTGQKQEWERHAYEIYTFLGFHQWDKQAQK